MTPWQVLGACVALAVAGFDPFGALALLAATARGAGRRAAVAFTAGGAAVILVAAMLLDLVAYAVLAHGVPHVPEIVWGSVEAVAALGLLVWGVRRLTRPAATPADSPPPSTPRRPAGTGVAPMALAGAAYGLTVLGDPGFWGLVALVHRLHAGPALGIAALWWLLSQSPLVALTAAIVLGAGGPVGGWIRRTWRRLAGPLGRIGTTLILLAGLLLAADVVLWLSTGAFLIG